MPWSIKTACRCGSSCRPVRPPTRPPSGLIDGLKPAQALVADRGYDARAVIDLVAARGGCAHIPTQKDRKIQRSIDPALYRQRNLVERYFVWSRGVMTLF